MRALIQRVKQAKVEISGSRPSISEATSLTRQKGATLQPIGEIAKGLLILLGVAPSDTDSDIQFLVDKISNLRIFEDRPSHSEATLLTRPKGATLGKMNLSLLDVKGEALVVSQFTLYADCRKGRRPSFTDAALPEFAHEMYKKFVQKFKETGLKVEQGEFGAMMDVSLVNSGPVTMMLDSVML